jgi:hypothetical protein
MEGGIMKKMTFGGKVRAALFVGFTALTAQNALACGGGDTLPTPDIGVDGNGDMYVEVGTQSMDKASGKYEIGTTVRCIDPEWKKHEEQTLEVVGNLCDPDQQIPANYDASVKDLSNEDLQNKLVAFCDGVHKEFPQVHNGTGNKVTNYTTPSKRGRGSPGPR